MARSEGPSISLFLPVHSQNWGDRGDQLRLNQQLDQSACQLLERGVPAEQIRALVKKIQLLPMTAEWHKGCCAVAAFVSPTQNRFFSLSTLIDAVAWGDNHFHVRPLLPLVVDSDEFLLLKLSELDCSLYLGNALGLTPLNFDDLPANLAEVRAALQGQRQLQASFMSAGGLESGGANYHRQGSQADAAGGDRYVYLHQIAAVIAKHFPRPVMPLVVATVAKNFAEWQTVSTYPGKLQALLPRNPDQVADYDLHDRAWEAAAPIRLAAAAGCYEQYQHAKGTGRVRAGLGKVIAAARKGQVATLFIDSRSPVLGAFDAQTESIELADLTQLNNPSDLVELAIRETVMHRGQVYPLERLSPTPALAEAILRQ